MTPKGAQDPVDDETIEPDNEIDREDDEAEDDEEFEDDEENEEEDEDEAGATGLDDVPINVGAAGDGAPPADEDEQVRKALYKKGAGLVSRID